MKPPPVGLLSALTCISSLASSDRPATGRWQRGPRGGDIHESSCILPGLPRIQRPNPRCCAVRVDNVFEMPQQLGGVRWLAYPHPQVIFQYDDGRTAELACAGAISVDR